jgi:hypothetical protein
LDLSLIAQKPSSVSSTLTYYEFLELRNSNSLVPDNILNQAPLLSYKNLGKQTLMGEYGSTRHEGYLTFALEILAKPPKEKSYRAMGLKIHLSLDDTIPGNIENGWNAIANVLNYYKIARTKVVNVDLIENDDPINHRMACGKQITLYASLHPDGTQWRNVLESFSQALDKNNVAPGYEPEGSNRINCYLSYRYDVDPQTGKRREGIDEQSKSAFPKGAIDPLKGVELTPVNRGAKQVVDVKEDIPADTAHKSYRY